MRRSSVFYHTMTFVIDIALLQLMVFVINHLADGGVVRVVGREIQGGIILVAAALMRITAIALQKPEKPAGGERKEPS